MKAKAHKPVKPLKQPIQQRSQLTVQAILEAAVHVFEKHGYAAGTTARIAQRAGVSIGSLYQYFPNKDSVLVSLAEQHMSDVDALALGMLEEVRSQRNELPVLIDQVVAGFLNIHAHNPGLHKLLNEGGLLPVEMRQKVRLLEVKYRVELAELLRQHPQVRRADHTVTAYFVVQCLEHFTHQLIINPPPKAIRDAGASELKLLLLSYLQPNGF